MKVLYLTPWYPSEKDAMSGLFVQKHVEAVRAQGCDVRVIFSQSPLDTIRQYKALLDEGWKPDLVQLNVIQKQGLLALALLKKERIPYIIVEHWSGYLPENGAFQKMPEFKRRFYRHVAREAEMVLTVSMPLQRAMKAAGFRAKRWGTIHNVVEEIFGHSAVSIQHSDVSRQPSDKKILLHVSCFDEKAKNVKGLLRAAKMLSEKRQDWQLVLIGTGVDYKEVRAYASEIEVPEGLLHWTGELSPQEVAEWMHRSDALVLSSRYETYGVVLAEAFVAGLPILSTPVGIAEDLGALIVSQEIAQHKAGTFAEFIETILWNTAHRTPSTNPFSADEIGKNLVAIYDSCLHRNI